jgi:hypothetical protein
MEDQISVVWVIDVPKGEEIKIKAIKKDYLMK